MANLNGFNAHEVEPITGFDPIPAGKYIAAITGSEMKATKDGDGSYLQLEFTVVDGEMKGRKVWSRLNLNNPNKQAVEIARGELSAICRAVGVMTPRDSVDLHNIPLEITVKVKKRQDNDEFTNEIAAYGPKGGQSTQGATKPAENQYDATPPWKWN